jgi:hypothetical protein
VEIGEYLGAEVEHPEEELFGDSALAVVLNGILITFPTTKAALVANLVAALKAAFCTPSVPDGTENRSADPRCNQLWEKLHAGDGAARLPGRSGATDRAPGR